MSTLLNVGDIIRIREDIQRKINYEMVLDTSCKNTWIGSDEMLPGGTLIQITKVRHGQYKVKNIDNIERTESQKAVEGLWDYTDSMFDPESIRILLEDRYNN